MRWETICSATTEVGLAAARALREGVDDDVEIVETGEAGLALLEMMEGYERVLLLDSIMTGEHPVGTVFELIPEKLGKVVAPSPHYAGLPEVFELARRCGIEFPAKVRILAMEIANPWEFNEAMTPPVAAALSELVERARAILAEWSDDDA